MKKSLFGYNQQEVEAFITEIKADFSTNLKQLEERILEQNSVIQEKDLEIKKLQEENSYATRIIIEAQNEAKRIKEEANSLKSSAKREVDTYFRKAKKILDRFGDYTRQGSNLVETMVFDMDTIRNKVDDHLSNDEKQVKPLPGGNKLNLDGVLAGGKTESRAVNAPIKNEEISETSNEIKVEATSIDNILSSIGEYTKNNKNKK